APTALNVIGYALAVLVISKWVVMFHRAKGDRYWDSLPHLRQAVGEAKGKQATLE
ncbi:glutamate/aspartate:proton symporter GltP, partial [Pseudomonas aeruginosa]